VKSEKLFWICQSRIVFNRVPREVIRGALCKLGVDECLLSAVMSICVGARTIVRTAMVTVTILR